MNFSLPVLFLLCLPLGCPAFYLAYKLAIKRQLGSIFNQNIFFLFIVTGGSIWSKSTGPSPVRIFLRILHGILRQQPAVHQPGLGGVTGGDSDDLRLRDLHETVRGVLVVQHLLRQRSLQEYFINKTWYPHYYVSSVSLQIHPRTPWFRSGHQGILQPQLLQHPLLASEHIPRTFHLHLHASVQGLS